MLLKTRFNQMSLISHILTWYPETTERQPFIVLYLVDPLSSGEIFFGQSCHNSGLSFIHWCDSFQHQILKFSGHHRTAAAIAIVLDDLSVNQYYRRKRLLQSVLSQIFTIRSLHTHAHVCRLHLCVWALRTTS